MSLNTMFTRKDIKNMNMIKKPEFISMNADCNPDFLSKLYDDLEQNPIVIDSDYLELIYKREAVQGSLVSFLNLDKQKAIQHSSSFVPRQQQDEILTEKQILDNLEAVKKGDVFHKYGNDDKPHKRFFQLTPDSKQLIWYDKNSFKIFRKIKKVNLIDINNVYIGINSSKIFEKFNIPLNEDQQCMSIICEGNNILALQNDNEATTKKWYYALKYLINHNKIYEKRKQTLDEEDIKYFDSESEMKISQLWRNDILINWKYYRRYLEDNYDRKELKKIKENSSSDGKVKITDENTGDDTVEIYDKYKFFEYWELGLPKFIRKKLWPIIIGNRAGITENLVEYYSKNIESLDFKQLNSLYLDYLQNKNERDEIVFSEDIVMNQIINDILKITNTKYKLELYNIPPESFAHSLFKIIRIFTLYRQDIIYSKEIAYISTIFLLNSENYYQALVNMVNFILDSPGIKFIQKNEHFIKMRTSFFKNLISKYLPRLNKHFTKLEITPELYFNRWISSFFIKAFPYDVLLKLWDNYIVKGEVFLFEISLTILKIQENDCLGLAYGKIVSNLRNIPFKVKYNEENFFNQLYKCDLSDEYEYIEETELGYEKAILLQSYMNDKV
jgi:cytohesin/brefeldin A-inhibited guanine nucleotide-exchange protein